MSELDDALDMFLCFVDKNTKPHYDGSKIGIIRGGHKDHLHEALDRLFKARGWEKVDCPVCGGDPMQTRNPINPSCYRCNDNLQIYRPAKGGHND